MSQSGIKLKFIFLDNVSKTFQHAQELCKNLESMDAKNIYNPKPKGIAHHTALTPVLCDECGETYWTKDEYGKHIGCKGFTRGLGFDA